MALALSIAARRIKRGARSIKHSLRHLARSAARAMARGAHSRRRVNISIALDINLRGAASIWRSLGAARVITSKRAGDFQAASASKKRSATKQQLA